MAAKWNFPITLVEAIQCHHAPNLAKNRPELSAIVNIANALCPLDQTTLSKLGKREVHPAALTLLKITPEKLETMRTNMMQYFRFGQVGDKK